MEKILSLKQLASAAGGVLNNCDGDIMVSDIVTDSRKISCGSVFVALRGEKFDGHNFAAQAIDSGAVCVVADKKFDNSKKLPAIVVEDTYAALRSMAAYYRQCFEIPAVAITGSVGKTSTKEMIAKVLEMQYSVLKTEGNFNNEIGLPLTAFRISKEDDIAVFEMGMSSLGEISRLTNIAKPEVAVLTNIGFSHIEHLGSQENILKAKLEVLDGLVSGGTVVLNGDDKLLNSVVGTLPFETLTYGIENTSCDIIAKNVKKSADSTEFEAEFGGESCKVKINVPGIHHVYNALAAILVGAIYNIPTEKIIEGVSLFATTGMRQNIVTLKDMVLIKDCYNASPTSMKSGLEILTVTKPLNEEEPGRRVAVLGDMLELGDFAKEAHRNVGEMCSLYGLDCLIAIGGYAEDVINGAIDSGFSSAELYRFYDNISAKEHINEILKPNDIVLFKGSRGMRLEEVADFVAESER